MDEKTIARFWSKVDRNGPMHPYKPELGPCWLWTGGRGHCGYGLFAMSHRRTARAHCLAWELLNGEKVPPGLWVLHTCDRTACVRHTYVGTAADNNRDMMSRGRHRHNPGIATLRHGLPESEIPRLRGEANGKCVLSDADCERLRARHADTGMYFWKLAAEFGISTAQAHKIVRRKARELASGRSKRSEFGAGP
jgi:hypothetical protein